MTDSQQKHDVVAADAQAALPSSSTVVTPAIEDTQPVASTSALPSTTASQGDIIAAPSAKQPAVRVYRPPADGSGPRIPDLPESYYQPSANDLRMAHAGQTNRLKSLGVDASFSTRKQRDADARKKEEKRVNRFPRTTIRIRFADRTQLETSFPSSRTLQSVYDFVKQSLSEEWRETPFILYIPPRSELRLNDPKIQGKSLLDLQLAPSSVLQVRFAEEKLNDHKTSAPLTQELLATAEDLPAPPSFDPTPQQLEAAQQAARVAEDDKGKSATLGGGSTGSKTPKWLQKIAPSKKA